MPYIAPSAEHILVRAIERALPMIRAGKLRDACRTLEVGLSAAEMLDADQETLETLEKV